MQRPSLLDGDDFSSIGGHRPTTQGPARGATVARLCIAGALLVCAGLISCWHFGIFDRPSAGDGASPEVHQTRVDRSKQDQAELDRLVKQGDARIDGS